MRVLVIGASGHIGNAIVRLLIKRRHKITACGRRKSPPANLIDLPIRYVSGDADIHGQLDAWVAGHDLVVDAAAPYPVEAFSPAANNGNDPVRQAMMRTQELLDAIRRHKARLLYIGSCATLARPQTAVQRFELSMIRLAHPYFYVKELIEDNILDACRRGLPAVIIDPAYCLGPWDIRERQYCNIPLLLDGEIPSSIDQVLHIVDVRDVAAASMRALHDKRYGEPILLSAYRMSARHLYSYICEVAGVPAPRYSLPTDLVLMGSYALETALTAAGIESPLNTGAIMISTTFDYLEAGHELEKLGIKPRRLSQTISDSIGWYSTIGYC